MTPRQERAAVITCYAALDAYTQAGLGADHWDSKSDCDIDGWADRLELLRLKEQSEKDTLAAAVKSLAAAFDTTPHAVDGILGHVMEEAGMVPENLGYAYRPREYAALLRNTLWELRDERRMRNDPAYARLLVTVDNAHAA